MLLLSDKSNELSHASAPPALEAAPTLALHTPYADAGDGGDDGGGEARREELLHARATRVEPSASHQVCLPHI